MAGGGVNNGTAQYTKIKICLLKVYTRDKYKAFLLKQLFSISKNDLPPPPKN